MAARTKTKVSPKYKEDRCSRSTPMNFNRSRKLTSVTSSFWT